MNIQLKYLGLVVLVAMALGAYLTRQFAPREVDKTQIVNHDVVHDHVVTVTKEITNKDGTKEVDTTTTEDKAQTNNQVKSVIDSKPDPVSKSQWFVTAGAGLDFSKVENFTNPIYQASVNRRILGPIYLGAYGNTKSQVGLQVGLEF